MSDTATDRRSLKLWVMPGLAVLALLAAIVGGWVSSRVEPSPSPAPPPVAVEPPRPPPPLTARPPPPPPPRPVAIPAPAAVVAQPSALPQAKVETHASSVPAVTPPPASMLPGPPMPAMLPPPPRAAALAPPEDGKMANWPPGTQRQYPMPPPPPGSPASKAVER